MTRLALVAVLLTAIPCCNSGILPLTPAARTVRACNGVTEAMRAKDCFNDTDIEDQEALCDGLAEQLGDSQNQNCDFSDLFECIEDRLTCDLADEDGPFTCLLALDPEDIELCPEFFSGELD